jgi:hypothetical protein
MAVERTAVVADTIVADEEAREVAGTNQGEGGSRRDEVEEGIGIDIRSVGDWEPSGSEVHRAS